MSQSQQEPGDCSSEENTIASGGFDRPLSNTSFEAIFTRLDAPLQELENTKYTRPPNRRKSIATYQ